MTGLEALDSRRIRMCTHVDDRHRRCGLNVPRRINAVHGPLPMDVHEYRVWAAGEGVFNCPRAASGQSHDLDNDNAVRRVHRATFGGCACHWDM